MPGVRRLIWSPRSKQDLQEIWRYFADLGRSTIEAWDRFFFTPADPTTLGLLRIIFGVLLFWDMAVLGDYAGRWFAGNNGWKEATAEAPMPNSPLPGTSTTRG